MKILCFGSLNIDLVFSVPHFVEGGETISSTSLNKSAGGKGANQSAALAKAGCNVYHAGKVGNDGRFIVELLKSYGVNTDNIVITEQPSGQAIIQLDDNRQNAIVLYPGENRNITTDDIDSTLSKFSSGDWIVLQNEINGLEEIIVKAHEKGIKICFNPAPFDCGIEKLPLSLIDIIVVNEIEGMDLAGIKGSFDEILSMLNKKFPDVEIIMTLGKHGSLYSYKGEKHFQPIIDLPVADTTAAGDTFIGFFIACRINGLSVPESLLKATAASALAVSRKGAMETIPYMHEVDNLLMKGGF